MHVCIFSTLETVIEKSRPCFYEFNGGELIVGMQESMGCVVVHDCACEAISHHPRRPIKTPESTTCRGGACSPVCRTGWEDADGQLDNGCEEATKFTLDEGCPSGVPTDGEPCSSVGHCAYFVPESPCVHRAKCHFRNIGDVYWIVGSETCTGRKDGAYCEADTECASGGCSEDGECLASLDKSCDTDDQCASGSSICHHFPCA